MQEEINQPKDIIELKCLTFQVDVLRWPWELWVRGRLLRLKIRLLSPEGGGLPRLPHPLAWHASVHQGPTGHGTVDRQRDHCRGYRYGWLEVGCWRRSWRGLASKLRTEHSFEHF